MSDLTAEKVESLKTVKPVVDNNGLVLQIPTLVRVKNALIESGVEIPYDYRSNNHHWYFPEFFYQEYNYKNSTDIAMRFRNLGMNQSRVPLNFHVLMHQILLPPEIPSPKVMLENTQSIMSLRILLQGSRNIIKWTRDVEFLLGNDNKNRKVKFPLEQLISKISGAEEIVEIHREQYDKVPVQSRVNKSLQPDWPLETVAKHLGKFVNNQRKAFSIAMKV